MVVKPFEEVVGKQSQVLGFNDVIAGDAEDYEEHPFLLESGDMERRGKNVIDWATELQIPISTARQNYDDIEKFKIGDPKELGLPTTGEEYQEMRLNTIPEEVGILGKLFAYEPAAKPEHYWEMGLLKRTAFDIYMAGRHILTRIGGTATTEMGLTTKKEVHDLYENELRDNPKWYHKAPEATGWVAEKAAEFYALKTLFHLTGLSTALTWAGTKMASPFVSKALVARGGIKVLPTLSKAGLKRLTLDGLAAFLRFAPENTAFLASWSVSSAALKKEEDIGEAALSGGLWGLGFSAIMPITGGLGKMAMATKCGQKLQQLASIAYTNLWIKHPRLMNAGRRAFSDEWLADMERQYKARFGIDPTAADKAMMKKMTRMVGDEITRMAQKDAAMKAYWESGKVVAKPPVPKPSVEPTEAIVKPSKASEAPVLKKGASEVVPPTVRPAAAKPEAAPKVEPEPSAAKVEKKFYTTIPEEWRKVEALYDWGQKGLRSQYNTAIKVKGQRSRKTFIWQDEMDKIPIGNQKFLREVKKRTDEVWPVKERRGKFWTTEYYLAPKQVIAEVKTELGVEVLKRPVRKPKGPTISETAQKRFDEITHKAETNGLLALDDNEFEVFINNNGIIPDDIERHEAGALSKAIFAIAEAAIKPSSVFVDITPVVEGFKRANDWIFTFGEVERTDPELYKKLMKSYAERSAAAEKAISEVERTVLDKNIRIPQSDNAQLSLIYEDKRLSLPDELSEYAELLDKGSLLMDRIEQISLKEGIFQRPFQERIIEELTDKRETLRAKLKHPAASKVIQKLTAEIETLKNMRYLPHNIVARRVIEQQLTTLTGEPRKKFLEGLSRISAKFKKRKGKLLLKDYLAEGLIEEKDIGFIKLITESLSDYYYRSSLKSLYDFSKAKGYIKPTSKKLRQEGWLNQREIGIISPELKEQLVHPVLASALAEMKDMRRGRVGLGRELMSMVKIGQFIKPSIIWIYNTVQKYMRGMYSLNPIKEAMSLARATQSVLTKDSLYHDLNTSNLYQFPYEVSRAGRDEQITMFVRKHQAETNRLISLAERTMGVSLDKADMTTKKAIKAMVMAAHRFVANSLTWTGDKIQRTQSYLVLRKMGYPHEEAVEVASKSHVAYSTISHKFKKTMSPIVFVYSFRMLAPVEVAKTLIEPMIAAGEYVFRGKKPPKYELERWAKALAGSVIMPILVDTYMRAKGFEPEGKHLGPLAWKYKKVVEVDGEEREVVVGLNYILNLPVKYWNRLTYDNPITPEGRWQEAIERIIKWEIHPLGRIFFWDIAENRRSFGTGLEVYDPTANPAMQIGQVAKYVFGQSFRFWGGMMDAIGEGEMTEKERTEQEKILSESLSKFDRVLFSVFGYKYIRLPLEERQAIMAASLMKEYRSRAFKVARKYDGEEKDMRLKNLETWAEKCKNWIEQGMK